MNSIQKTEQLNQNDLIFQVRLAMMEYFKKDAKRIQHFMKVHSFASIIGKMEHLPEQTQEILELAALVHDIGIRPGEEKFGRNDGKIQEQEGPEPAKKLLETFKISSEKIERICYLVGHHHTYSKIEGADYQILVEADFLVNLYEDQASKKAVLGAYETIFRTDSGKQLFTLLYTF